MATCTELRASLVEFEAARDKIMLGKGVVRVRDGENELQYRPADLPAVQARINQLRAEIARNCGGTAMARRVIGIIPQG